MDTAEGSHWSHIEWPREGGMPLGWPPRGMPGMQGAQVRRGEGQL